MSNRLAGRFFFNVDGVQQDAKGQFTYQLSGENRTAIVGPDRVHGFSAEVKVPFIEGKVTDRGSLDVAALQALEDTTVTLELQNGKVIVLRDAWFAGEGNISTDNAEIDVRFEGLGCEEVTANG